MTANDATPEQRKPKPAWWDDPETTIEDRLAVYGQFRRYIQHEDGLINNRLSWMLTIHGFLYAAYALAITKQQETVTALATSVALITRPPAQPFIDAVASQYTSLSVFMGLISLVGIGISSFGGYSIRMAIRSITDVSRLFRIQSRMYTFDRETRAELPINARQLELKEKTGRMAYRSMEGLVLPRMAGGSDRDTAKKGSSAARYIPFILAGVWLASMAWLFANQIDIRSLYSAKQPQAVIAEPVAAVPEPVTADSPVPAPTPPATTDTPALAATPTP